MSTSSSASAKIWSFPEMVEYLQSRYSDEEVAEGNSAEEFSQSFNSDKDWISKALENQGFEPRVMLAQLLKNKASYLAQKPVDLKFEIGSTGGKTYYFTNKENIAKDLHFLIIAGLARNSHINKTITVARGQVKDILCTLKEKYDINNGDRFLGPRVVTLPRIIRVFPTVAVRYFHMKEVTEVVPYNTFPGCTKPETHAICCPLLQSVCPFTLKAENNFHPVMLWVQIKFDDKIHRWDGKTTSVDNILSYYRASYQTKAVPEPARLKVFSYIGIIIQEDSCSGQNWKLTNSSAQLAANCLSELGNMRKEDENHALLMKLAKSGEF